MQRQLYRSGGITQVGKPGGLVEPGIVKYGALDFITDPIKKVGERVRKLIPKELADVAVKAAPFVAPFNPGIAGLMRGIGRYDQRGSLSDALKQGVATYGLGQGARYLGGAGMQTGFNPMGGMGAGQGAWSSPMGPSSPISKMWGNITGGADKAVEGVTTAKGSPSILAKTTDPNQGFLNKVLYGEKGGEGFFGDKGLIGKGGGFDMKGAIGKGLPAVYATSVIAARAVQAAMGNVGGREPGESLEAFNKRRKGTVSQYLDFYFRRANKFRIAPENMDAAAAKFVADNTKEYVSHGGRIGLANGSELEKNIFLQGGESLKRLLMSKEEKKKDKEKIKKQLRELGILKKAEGGRIGYQTGGITMANTLQENIRRNQAQAAANEGMLQAARSRLPGYVPQQITQKDVDQTGMPQQITQKDVGTYNFIPPTEEQSLTMGPVSPVVGPRGPGPLGIVPPQDPGDFGPGGIVIDGKRYYSEEEAIEDMGIERYNMFMSKGGRVGLKHGTPEAGIKNLDAGAPDITYEGNEGPQAPMNMAFDDASIFEMRSLDLLIDEFREDNNGQDPISIDHLKQFFYNKYGPEGIAKVDQATKGKQMAGGQPLPEDPTKPINPFAPKPTGPVLPNKMMAAQGGRIGQLYGTGPAGLPGIPRQASDGMEFDMRQNGGFQGLGAKEGKDDVPAMLAKNEFVFTADAVRGAGGGDIELGAQRMYDTMKNLEKRVV